MQQWRVHVTLRVLGNKVEEELGESGLAKKAIADLHRGGSIDGIRAGGARTMRHGQDRDAYQDGDD